MKLVLFLIFLSRCIVAYPQLSGKVTLPHAGVEFTIPQGWIGQETAMGYILGSQTEAGAIFLSSHQSTSLETLRQEAMKGIYEEGLQLNIDGALENLGENSIGGNYAGMLQGQTVKAYGVGLINPHGRGVSILAVTTPQMFTERHRQLAKEIASTMRFFKAEASPVVNEWKNALTNARLTYMDSYSTQGGGYSNKIVIDLCPGYFRRNKNNSLNADVGGVFGSGHSGDQGSGTWQVIPDASGDPILELTFTDGQVQEYRLQYVNDQTLLNGVRYFRTNDAGCY